MTKIFDRTWIISRGNDDVYFDFYVTHNADGSVTLEAELTEHLPVSRNYTVTVPEGCIEIAYDEEDADLAATDLDYRACALLEARDIEPIKRKQGGKEDLRHGGFPERLCTYFATCPMDQQIPVAAE